MIKVEFIQDLFKKVKLAFGRLEKKQKIIIILLVLSIAFSFYFNKILKPLFRQVSLRKLELSELKRKVNELKTEFPSLEKQRVDFEQLKAKNRKLKTSLARLESELPDSYRISQLLGELAKQSSGLAIDFSYIKPKSPLQATEDEYTKLDIEIQFDAAYHDFRAYLTKLENLSPYLNITDIVVDEMKESSFSGDTTVVLILSTLLTKESGNLTFLKEEQRKKHIFAEDGSNRNPFLPSSKTFKEFSKGSKYLLSGITFAGKNSTAVINNQIYRIGEPVDGKWPIKQILPNMVIIRHGGIDEVLTLER